MLETIGARGSRTAGHDPGQARLVAPPSLPPALAETELVRHLRQPREQETPDAESAGASRGAPTTTTCRAHQHLILRG